MHFCLPVSCHGLTALVAAGSVAGLWTWGKRLPIVQLPGFKRHKVKFTVDFWPAFVYQSAGTDRKLGMHMHILNNPVQTATDVAEIYSTSTYVTTAEGPEFPSNV